MNKTSLVEVNKLGDAAFDAQFGNVAEHSPWVARAAALKRPFTSVSHMISCFEQSVQEESRDLQLALIKAHPDLAGKAALAGEVAAASREEQAGAGLDTLTKDEMVRFQTLNDAYCDKFSFPFIFAVKGATKYQILDAFVERMDNSVETEFDTALAQIARIFRFRIEDSVDP
ncbi:MAG: 2-oxo-4-hydroxy-4-carboxy-5-ureidoimidazoline decarboxylase [Cohaesibacteraceae bacterium]|nr:2-oxo-4-hydroxy-4-carboxy-5-ureidoimidazoline decarboxylase [Cohaesibacteraceae bacterium]